MDEIKPDQNQEDTKPEGQLPSDSAAAETSIDEAQPAEVAEAISFSTALTGVFFSPGDTFEQVRVSSKKNYWIVPIILFILLSVASTFLVFRDAELSSEIKSKQTEAMKKRFDQQVKEGKMSQEQANDNMEKMQKGFDQSNPIFYVFTIAGPIITIFILFFIEGGIILGALKIFKGTGTYMKILSVLGLTSIISSVQVIIDTFLAIIMGKLNAGIGPTLILTSEGVGENLYKFLGHFDILTIWYVAVISIGLAKVSNLKNAQTVPLIFGLWLIWCLVTSFSNFAFFGG